MAARSICVLMAVLALTAGACGTTESVTTGRSAAPAVSPSAESSTVPPLVQPSSAPPLAGSRTATVYFSNLPAGSYPVHLHARCNASQGYHITVIGFLAVAANGQGAISVPAQDFGRGWCLIVYGSTSLQTVLTTRSL